MVLAPVVTAQCLAHHYLVESLLRWAGRDPGSSKLLTELAREAVERCHFELYGREARAAGIIEDLVGQLERGEARIATTRSERRPSRTAASPSRRP